MKPLGELFWTSAESSSVCILLFQFSLNLKNLFLPSLKLNARVKGFPKTHTHTHIQTYSSFEHKAD